MPRFNFSLRIALLISVAITGVWIIALGSFLRSEAEEYLDIAPDPERLAAIAGLFDTANPNDLPRLIAALNTDRFLVSLGKTTPESDYPQASPEFAEQYRIILGERLVSVEVKPLKTRNGQLPRLIGDRIGGYTILISLAGGQYLAIDTSNPPILTRFGFPLGFGAGLFGTGVAFIALLIMLRETRPLLELASAVDNVDFASQPVALPAARGSAPEIRAVIAAFDRLQSRLGVVLKARMALVGGISHDVRTYATRFRLRVDSITDATERERAEQDISDMIRLLDDALLSTRAGAGELGEELIDFNSLVASEIDDRRYQGFSVGLEGPSTSGENLVLGDRLALRRVITNLVENALKYGDAARLRTAVSKTTISLIVDDDGPGIPAEQRELMLEPFERLEQSRNRRTGGAGLGLAVVRSLVAAHGGTLSIGDAESGGTRITVTLPLFKNG